MAWQGVIRSKEIRDGSLTVVVDASDGISKFSTQFTTNQPQSDTWIQDSVTAQFNATDALKTFADSIQVGQVIAGK